VSPQLDGNHSLIFGTDQELVRASQQSSGKYPGRQSAGEMPALENSDTEYRAHVCLIARDRDGLNLGIGEPLGSLKDSVSPRASGARHG